MTTAYARWLGPFVVSLLLSGCGNFSLPGTLGSSEADLFALGMDRYAQTGDLSTLESLTRMYPRGPWRDRADTVLALVEQQKQQQNQLEERDEKLGLLQARLDRAQDQKNTLQKEKKTLRRERDALQRQKYSLIQEKSLLTQDNQSLEMTLERLKKVLIDNEMQN